MKSVEQRLTQWITGQLSAYSGFANNGFGDGEVDISFEPIGDVASNSTDKKPCIRVVLKDILPAANGYGANAQQLSVLLNYVVYIDAESHSQGNALIEPLLFAAMQAPDLEINLQPCSEYFWRAMGLSPRPCFLLQIPHHQVLPERLAAPVTQPMEMNVSPQAYLSGRVYMYVKGKSNKLPVSGASVSLMSVGSAFGLTVVTDETGRFNLGAVPASPKAKKINVLYKKRSQQFDVNLHDSPIELVFKTEEI